MMQRRQVTQGHGGENDHGLERGDFGDRPCRSTVILVVVGLLLATLAALAIDRPLSQWLLAGNCPKPLVTLFHVAEPFGHGMGVVLILLAIHQLAPGYRRALPYVVAGSLGAGLSANVIKMSITRMRPHHFDFATGIWHSFGTWFPLTSAGSTGQSFPSGHVATAMGLATVLAWLLPRGRIVFYLLASLVACHRIESGAHFLSDTLAGAAVGVAIAHIAIHLAQTAAHRTENSRPGSHAVSSAREPWYQRRDPIRNTSSQRSVRPSIAPNTEPR
ncbi:MAG: phosphatase PAP2 family protein [Pirellulales bacterium]